jgi:segregation and condensation protein A
MTAALAAATFQLQLPIFTGEIDELARLVSEHKISADVVPMADLVNQLGEQLSRQEGLELDEIGEVVGVACRLLLLKSARLLAVPVEKDEGEDNQAAPPAWPDRETYTNLAGQLRAWEGAESIAPLAPPYSIERRSEPRRPDVLLRLWHEIARRPGPTAAEVAVPAFVRLETAVSSLLRHLKTSTRLSLRGLLRGATRNDAVMHFLAVLELARRREIVVNQGSLFEDITVEYVERADESSIRAG